MYKPRKESNSSNCSNVFTTPIDIFYNNENSEDEVMSSQENFYLNDMLKDYCGNDEYDNLSYKKGSSIKKTSCSTNDMSVNEKNEKESRESFESLHSDLFFNYKEVELIKLSKILKDDWKPRANSFKLNNFINMKESIKLASNSSNNYQNATIISNNKGSKLNFNNVDNQNNSQNSQNTLNNHQNSVNSNKKVVTINSSYNSNYNYNNSINKNYTNNNSNNSSNNNNNNSNSSIVNNKKQKVINKK